jgi:8-oxo-dGTP pyrophosphatase MutT (NUDIX family)
MTKVIGSKEVYDGRIFKCHELVIETDEETIITRNLVCKSPCVVALVRHRGEGRDQIVLTKEFRVGTMKKEYGFVAGMIDEGESPSQAIVRELNEETGYRENNINKITYLGQSETSSGFTDELIHYFYIEVVGEPSEQHFDHDENIELEYVDYNKLLPLINAEVITSSHAQVCTLKYFMHKGVL